MAPVSLFVFDFLLLSWLIFMINVQIVSCHITQPLTMLSTVLLPALLQQQKWKTDYYYYSSDWTGLSRFILMYECSWMSCSCLCKIICLNILFKHELRITPVICVDYVTAIFKRFDLSDYYQVTIVLGVFSFCRITWLIFQMFAWFLKFLVTICWNWSFDLITRVYQLRVWSPLLGR